MVCPMKQQGGGRQEKPTDYPYEPLYRPWSWALSSASNIFLFAVLFGAIYTIYRQRRSKGKRQVGFRTVETKKTEVLEAQGKIKAVVTGGSGGLGKEIVRQLVEDGGYQVYSLGRIIPDSEDRNEDVYSYIQADITDRDSLRLALRDIEVVYHTAAIILNVGYTTQDFYDVIATGTENVVAICKEHKVKRLIYTSSIATMLSSDPNQVIENLDESTPYPEECRDAYGGAKVVAEKCVIGSNGSNGLLTCVLRPSGIASAKTVGYDTVRYPGDGMVLNQMSPVDTTARVHILAEKKLKSEGGASVIAGKPYIVVLEDSFTYRELAELVALERFGEKSSSIPLWVVKLLAYFNMYVYSLTGKAPVNGFLCLDTINYITKSHTFSSTRGRKEIGWEDKRTWKDVVRQLIKEADESKKNK